MPEPMNVTLTINGNDTPFIYDAGPEPRTVKLLLRDRAGDAEDIWCRLNAVDVADYDADVMDGTIRVAALMNDSLAGIPWGTIVPYILNGRARPVCDLHTLTVTGSMTQVLE